MDERITIAGPPDPMDKAQWRRSVTPSVAVDRPFDPAPLMGRLRDAARGDRFRFALLGDTHHSAAFQRIIRLIGEMDVDFVVAAGDLVDLGGGREAQAEYARLADEAGDFLRSAPVWPAIGNHDADSRWDHDVWNGFANFKAFFNLPPYYRFEFGNATFLVLSWMLPDAEELAWLTAQLADRRAEHVFVAAHYPLYNVSAAYPPQVRRSEDLTLRALLAEHRVTAHLSGHSHLYHRTARDGVTYLVSGGAGGKMSTLQSPLPVLRQDSYAGLDPRTGRYILHTPDHDEFWDAQQYFLTLIDVAGPAVRGRTVSTTGRTWEVFSIHRSTPSR